jgi:hypothetical protein
MRPIVQKDHARLCSVGLATRRSALPRERFRSLAPDRRNPMSARPSAIGGQAELSQTRENPADPSVGSFAKPPREAIKKSQAASEGLRRER